MEYLNTQHRQNVREVLKVGILQRMFGQCVTTPLVCLSRMSATWSYRNSTVFGRTSGTEQLHCSNSCETFCVAIAVSQTDSIALAGIVLPSLLNEKKPADRPVSKYLR